MRLGDSVRLNATDLSRPINGPFSGSLLGSKDSFISRRLACKIHSVFKREHRVAVLDRDCGSVSTWTHIQSQSLTCTLRSISFTKHAAQFKYHFAQPPDEVCMHIMQHIWRALACMISPLKLTAQHTRWLQSCSSATQYCSTG